MSEPQILNTEGNPVVSAGHVERCPHCGAGRQYLANRAGFGPVQVIICTVCGQVAGEENVHVS